MRLKAAAPPSASTACCSHVFPTKPCGHIVSETNLTATGRGSIATAAAERAAAVPVGSMGWRVHTCQHVNSKQRHTKDVPTRRVQYFTVYDGGALFSYCF